MSHMRLRELTDDQFMDVVVYKRSERMSKIDALPPELRELVHEYGYAVVDQFIRCGVTKPKHIRHLIEHVLNELSPVRGAYSSQGVRTEVIR